MTKQKIDGVLLFNKSSGLSSNSALQRVKRLFNAEKAGHTGTLDPLASGLLPICFGEATKFSSFLLDADKEYIATIKFGEVTTTYDADGDIVSKSNVKFSKDELNQCIKNFTGQIIQVPPIYSALKVNGKPLYEYARSGEDVQIKQRNVNILELESIGDLQDNILRIRVLCSKGTYIRSLAHDIGQKLECGAHLIDLVRTKTNYFDYKDGIDIAKLQNLYVEDLYTYLLPIDVLVRDFPRLDLTDLDFSFIKNGHQFFSEVEFNHMLVRLYYMNKFLGMAKVDNKVIKPVRLLTNQAILSVC